MKLRFAFAIALGAVSVAASAQVSNPTDTTSTAIQDEVDLNNTTFPDDHVQTGNSSGFNKSDSSTLGAWGPVTFGNGHASGTGESASATAQYASGIFQDQLSTAANLSSTGTIFANSFDEATSYANAADNFNFTATSNETLTLSDTLTGSNSPFTVDLTPFGGSAVVLLKNGTNQATFQLVSGKNYTLTANLTSNPLVIVNNGSFTTNSPGTLSSGLDVTADFGATPEPFTLALGLGAAALFVRRRLSR